MAVSVWQDKSGELTREVDALVIGAGLLGCAIANEARRHCGSVAILDSSALAGAATGRSAGILSSAMLGNYWGLIERVGRAQAQLLWQQCREGTQQGLELCRRHGLPYEWQPGAWLALGPAEAQQLEWSAAALGEDGFPTHALRRMPAGRGFELSLPYPEVLCVDPVRLSEVLLRQSGAVLYEGCEVFALVSENSHVEAFARRGSFRARHVFLATDLAAAGLLRSVDLPIQAQGAQVLVTEPLPPLFAGVGWVEERRITFRQLPDGRLLAFCRQGPAGDGSDVSPAPPPCQVELERAIFTWFPEARGRLLRRWSGTFAQTADLSPLQGKLERDPRIAFAVGLGGHGLSQAFSVARAVVASAFMGLGPNAMPLYRESGTQDASWQLSLF